MNDIKHSHQHKQICLNTKLMRSSEISMGHGFAFSKRQQQAQFTDRNKAVRFAIVSKSIYEL
jgi:hypothetical protein